MRTHGTVRTADGTEVAYQLDGAGPPLLLLAGQANNHHWWDAVRADLLAYRTLSLDWRGAGDSEDGPADFTTRTLAADVVALLDQLGIETLDVYGTSMGGRGGPSGSGAATRPRLHDAGRATRCGAQPGRPSSPGRRRPGGGP